MNLGIVVEMRESIFLGNDVIRSLNAELENYSQTIVANGGYDKAGFSIAETAVGMEDWIENGLGRDIVTYDQSGKEIWNGFINKVSITSGGRVIQRGPLIDVVNRVVVSYARLESDSAAVVPIFGAQTNTAPANDAASQAKYGILEETISGDRVTDADALLIRDSFLEERKDPENTEDLTSESQQPYVTVECLGYGAAYLGKYAYASVAAGLVSISSKIDAVLSADPNGLFTNRQITTNAATTATAETSARAWSVLMGLVAKGDSTARRYTLGVYERRKVVYAPVPTIFAYQHRLTENLTEIFGGGEIMPWEILPARWLFYPDFMAGRTSPIAARSDPRALFIESVTFTAPMRIAITGGKVSRTPQILARLGIGGIS